jgi:hypothetical protein
MPGPVRSPAREGRLERKRGETAFLHDKQLRRARRKFVQAINSGSLVFIFDKRPGCRQKSVYIKTNAPQSKVPDGAIVQRF